MAEDTKRAFIIAIENYPKSVGMANQLKGTNEGAQRFYDWLVGVKKLKPEHIISCVEEAHAWRTDGTTRPEIMEALDRFVTSYRDKTEELYFFFSGHGFSYEESSWGKPLDVLVTSEYQKPSNSGGACLQLQEVQEKLYTAMGPGEHYYFVEACRNVISQRKINVTDTGYSFAPSDKRKPSRYTLYATAPGEVAAVAGHFREALVQGLNGKGRAKGWKGGRMFVTFNSLCEYVGEKLSEHDQEVVPYIEGTGKAIILEISPVPEPPCAIVVDNAAPGDQFVGQVSTPMGQTTEFKFVGPNHSIKLRPFEYSINVTHQGSELERVKPPPDELIDLYDECEVHFKKLPRMRGLPPPEAAEPVEMVARLDFAGAVNAEGAEVEIEEIGTGEVTTQPLRELTTRPVTRGISFGVGGPSPQLKTVRPGTYIIKVRERGMTVSRRKVTVKPGEQVKVDLLDRPKSAVKERILEVVTGKVNSRVTVFAKNELGAMTNWDLGLWLSLFGALRILGTTGPEFEQLSDLSLASFDDAKKDDTFVYVLAGLEKSESNPRMGLSQRSQVAWQPLEQVAGLERIYQLRLKASQGSHLLSIELPGGVPYTFSTYCLPNRTTLFVIAENENGQLTVHQYLLPISHLFEHLPFDVLRNLNENPLAAIRLMFLAQTRFARKRSLEIHQGDLKDRRILKELIYGKWLDPVMSLIAAYDVIRQEGIEEARKRLNIMVGNLRNFFGGVPDIEVIAKMLKLEDASLPLAPPLLLEGMLIYDAGEKKKLPLPANKLDYGTPWTSWVDAVSEKAVKAEPRPAAKKGGAKKGARKR